MRHMRQRCPMTRGQPHGGQFDRLGELASDAHAVQLGAAYAGEAFADLLFANKSLRTVFRGLERHLSFLDVSSDTRCDAFVRKEMRSPPW